MAVTVDATVGGATANSYVTLVAADAALEARLNTTLWDAATDDTKNRALVEAQAMLQTLSWKGSRVDTTQALAWPRDYVEDPDAPFDAAADTPLSDALYYATDAIPDRVTQAQIELAFQFVKAGTVDIAMPDATAGVIEKTVDVLTTKYAQPHERATAGLARFPRVRDLLAPLLSATAGGLTVVRA